MKKFMGLSVLIFFPLLFGGEAVIQSETSPDLPSRLVFYTDSDVFYVDPHTLEVKVLFHLGLHNNTRQVTWSPDGRYLAIVGVIGPNQSRISIITDEGYEIRHIDLPLWNPDFYRFPIQWNTDDRNISVLLRSENDLPQLGVVDMQTSTVNVNWTMPLDGMDLERIYWSPTGAFMAYQIAPTEPPNVPVTDPQPLPLYLMNVQAGETQLLTDQSYDNCVTWSNGGNRLGVVTSLTKDPTQWVLKTDGLEIFSPAGRVVEELSPFRYKDQDVFGCPFSWSHDDTLLAFSGQFVEENDLKADLFVVQVDSADIELAVETDYGVLNIAWSPDNAYLAVDTLLPSAGRDVRVISLNGWQQRYTVEGSIPFNSSWQPSMQQ